MLNLFEKFIDMLVDRIINFTDYFIVKQHITLSETLIFSLTFSRAIWFTIFGVHMVNSDALVNHYSWQYVFILVSLLHFTSFFFNSLLARAGAVTITAFIWCILAGLTSIATIKSAAFPTFIVFSLLSIFISVRLVREWRNTSCEA